MVDTTAGTDSKRKIRYRDIRDADVPRSTAEYWREQFGDPLIERGRRIRDRAIKIRDGAQALAGAALGGMGEQGRNVLEWPRSALERGRGALERRRNAKITNAAQEALENLLELDAKNPEAK